MADRVELTVQQAVRTGVTPTYNSASANNNTFANDGHTIIEVKNTSGSPINVTIETPGTVDGNAVADLVVAVPATSGDKIIGPFPPSIYNQTGGVIYLDWSATTNVTVAVIRV